MASLVRERSGSHCSASLRASPHTLVTLPDPEIQYKYYALQAYNFSIAATGKPVISLSTYEQMTAAIPNCISLIKDCQTLTGDCGYAQQVCNEYVRECVSVCRVTTSSCTVVPPAAPC